MTTNKLWMTGVAVALLQLTCFAKPPRLTGKMLAYDPFLHGSKAASGIANKEVVILKSEGQQKIKYWKMVFISFSASQIDEKYFDGTQPLTVQVLRDHTCDERYPNLVQQLSLHENSETYLLTDAFKNSPPSKIKNLPCYEVTRKK